MKFTFPPESKPLDGYTIKRAIHRGGFGEVYYALSDAGKEVALKLLQQNMDVELRGVSQCLNLKHPNLVTIFDIRVDADGDHWIVMEYVSGKSLDAVLDDQNGPLPLTETTEWLEGIVAGLSFLHDRGIVHRDLKPANIYREGGVVKIGDVGLAKFISESRRSAQTESVGTVYYMAPEVARGRYGREVDVYSLGIVLYELLTGDVPFDGESTAEILMKHLSEKPDLARLPAKLRPVLANALEKDPQRRTPTAAHLLAEFRQAVSGIDVAVEIPEESFVAATVTDSSVAHRERWENSAMAPLLRLPEGHGHRFRKAARRAQREFRRAAHHARIEARKAADHARLEARRAIKYAKQHHYHPGQDGDNGRQANAAAAARTDAGNDQFGFWLRVAAVVVVVMALAAPGFSLRILGSVFVVGIYAAIGYGVYRLILYFSNSSASNSARLGNPTNPLPNPAAAAVHAPNYAAAAAWSAPEVQPVHVRVVKPTPAQKLLTPKSLRPISVRSRLSDLTGSMTVAAFCTLLFTLALSLAKPLLENTSQVGLFGLTTLFACWAVLVPAKLLEGRGADSGLMRLVQLGAGMAVGLFAYWLHGVLMADGPLDNEAAEAIFTQIGSYQLLIDTRSRDPQPTLAGYMVFFGALFALRRWWWQCDSFRKRRFRVISVLLTAGLAMGISFVWAFPKPWALIWAAAISCIIQLSAGWVPPKQRS